MEEIYNKWQLQDKDLGNTECFQFTKSELLDFAKYYQRQLNTDNVSKSFYCETKRGCLEQCDDCALTELSKDMDC